MVRGGKGIPKSEEHKRKIGLANRGKVRTQEHKKLISIRTKQRMKELNSAKLISAKLREKYMNGFISPTKGIKRPDLAKWNKDNPMKGNKNPAWIDGRSEGLKYPKEFFAIRLSILKRDDNTCQLCGDKIVAQTKNKFISVHHIDYDITNNNALNLITLCNFCNSSVNKSRAQWTQFFRTKLAQEVREKHG